MIIIENKVVLDVLNHMNRMGKSYIFGGYIRDTALNTTPKDIDICTSLKVEEVLSLYPQGIYRKSASGFEIVNFTWKGLDFEIVTNIHDIKKKLTEANYTLNSLAYDGYSLHDYTNGLKDINEKVIRQNSPSVLMNQLSINPPLITKTISLISKTGFHVELETTTNLINHLYLTDKITDSIRKQEFYNIIQSAHNLEALKFMFTLGILDTFDGHATPNPFSNEKVKKSLHFTLTWMALQTSYNTVEQFLNFFRCPALIRNNYYKLYRAFNEEENSDDFSIFNETLILRRHFEARGT